MLWGEFVRRGYPLESGNRYPLGWAGFLAPSLLHNFPNEGTNEQEIWIDKESRKGPERMANTAVAARGPLA